MRTPTSRRAARLGRSEAGVGTVVIACVVLAGGLLGDTSLAAPRQTAIRMDVLWPYYHPSVATVAAETPVTWVNPTSMPHTVTHDACGQGAPCAFQSAPVPPGETFVIPGLPPGRYAYHCALHPSMRGVLVVQDSIVHMSAAEREPDVRLVLRESPPPLAAASR